MGPWGWIRVGEGPTDWWDLGGFFSFLGICYWASVPRGQFPKWGLRGENCLPNTCPPFRFGLALGVKDVPPCREISLNLGKS